VPSLDPELTPFFRDVVRTLLSPEPKAAIGSAAELEQVFREGERSEFWRMRAEGHGGRHSRAALASARDTVFCGRDAEMAELRAAWSAARAGEARVIVVTGDAGIGKSRLLEEFTHTVEESGEESHLLAGSSAPSGETGGFSGFVAAYRAHFGNENAARALAELLQGAEIAAETLAALIAGDGKGSDASEPDQLQAALVETALALARRQPTLLILEDLHFAAQQELNAFLALARAAPGSRFLLVGSTRPGLPESWQAEIERLSHAIFIGLSGLTEEGSRHLLAELLHSETLAEEVGDELTRRSDGNPFVMLEILRALEGRGQLIRRPDGHWVKHDRHAQVRDMALPETLVNLIRGRAAQLSPRERDVIEAASCLGFRFDPLLVAASLGITPVALFQSLAALEHSHRLVRSGEPAYVFEHHQVQEAIYSGLPGALRQNYHFAIAEVLEGRALDDAGSAAIQGAAAVDLCWHFLRCGAPDRARPYLDSALRHLRVTYDSRVLVALIGEALKHEDAFADGQRVDLLLRQAEQLGTAAVGKSGHAMKLPSSSPSRRENPDHGPASERS